MNMVFKKKSLEGDENDIISHLPDDILCHILSFISISDSVTTCILSKRWKHLWEYVHILNFDDSIVYSYNLLHSSQYVRFANIVNRALSHHTNLSQLSLKCRQNNDLYDITKWLTDSITRNIQSLDLNIYDGEVRFELPSSIFSCKTLESLMLEGNILIIVPSHACLPKLRTLKLARLYYKDDDGSLISSSSSLESIVIEHTNDKGHLIVGSNRQMLSSTLRQIKLIIKSKAFKNLMVPSNVFTFQTLEKLTLEGSFIICALPDTICMPNLTYLELVQVQYQDHQIFSTLISSCTSLESLKVDNYMEAELNICSCTLKLIELKLTSALDTSHKLVINAPSLKYLKLNVIGGMIDYQIEGLASLEQAVVAVQFDWGISHDYCSSSLMNIYQEIHHVKSLKVHIFSQGCGFGHVLPMFTRLTELDICIQSYTSSKGGALLEFLNNSTKLENLRLNGICGFSWRNPNSVPACLLTSVKNVSITSFRGGVVGEMVMVKYILGNARVLEKMEVCFPPYSDDKKTVSKTILNFCRASEKCVVLIE